MPFSPLPDLIADSLTDISPELLHRLGIRLLMLDFDNTIVPYTTCVPTEEMRQWFEKMKGQDILLCIVSNSHSDRVPGFCRENGLECITRACKPFSKSGRGCVYRLPVCPQCKGISG